MEEPPKLAYASLGSPNESDTTGRIRRGHSKLARRHRRKLSPQRVWSAGFKLHALGPNRGAPTLGLVLHRHPAHSGSACRRRLLFRLLGVPPQTGTPEPLPDGPRGLQEDSKRPRDGQVRIVSRQAKRPTTAPRRGPGRTAKRASSTGNKHCFFLVCSNGFSVLTFTGF